MRPSLIGSIIVTCTAGLTAAIWPEPTSYTNGSTVLKLSSNIHGVVKPLKGLSYQPRYNANNVSSPESPVANRNRQSSAASTPSFQTLVEAAFDRFTTEVKATQLVPWKFYPRGAKFEPTLGGNTESIDTVTIEQVLSSANASAGIDESYSLTVAKDGTVDIRAATSSGAIYALGTLEQLFYKHSGSGDIYTPLAPVAIQDAPVFQHRGLNVDISRNYISPSDIMRTIDSMSFNKFNRLHLHAADAQSWPLEIPALPKLATAGAYYTGLTWSVADLKNVQAYAQARAIQAYIEIDSPGHTAAVAYAYPDLITAFNEKQWQTYAAEPPSGQLKLNYPPVTTFIDTLYKDLLPRLSPYNTIFHTGGDEINANAYLLDPSVASNDSTVIQPYLASFITHAHSLVRANHMTPIVWEETLLTWNVSLPPNDTIVQTWIGQDSLAKVVASGHKALFGDYLHWYLDCGYGQWIDPLPSPNTVIVPPYTDYCSPYKSWRQVYSYDPLANISASDAHLIVGGEAHAWGELQDPVNLDNKVWPRASAAAEILWSGVKGQVGVTEAVTRRLAEMRERLVERGVGAHMVQMQWCLQNVGGCQL